jgi:hypothetical protein
MDDFRNALVESHLSDLGFNGSKFTWMNCRHDGSFVKERLDCAVANNYWCGMYPRRDVDVLAARSSDHKPLLIRIGGEDDSRVQFYRSFKFEAKWLLDEECQHVIWQAWDEGHNRSTLMQTAMGKLGQCHSNLVRWSGKKFGDMEKKIKELTKQLEEFQRVEGSDMWESIKVVQREIEYLLEQEDIRWKQHAKQNWYQYGDHKTLFFHAWASHC